MSTAQYAAFKDFEVLFGTSYARQLEAAGSLDDGVANFEGLQWSARLGRAVVVLPGELDAVVVDDVEEVVYDDATDQYTAHYDGAEYTIPREMAWGLRCLRELRRKAYEALPSARRLYHDCPPSPPPAWVEEDPVIEVEDPIAVFRSDVRRFGMNVALDQAMQPERIPAADRPHLDFRRFAWDDRTARVVVTLPLLRWGRWIWVRVPLDYIGEIRFADDDGEEMEVWCVPLGGWIAVPKGTQPALDHLLNLRDESAVMENDEEDYDEECAASPAAGGAVPPQPPPGSPGRADSTSPCAATLTNDYHDTAPAAAGASTADEAMVASDSPCDRSETRTLDDDTDYDGSADDEMSVDDDDVGDLYSV